MCRFVPVLPILFHSPLDGLTRSRLAVACAVGGVFPHEILSFQVLLYLALLPDSSDTSGRTSLLDAAIAVLVFVAVAVAIFRAWKWRDANEERAHTATKAIDVD